MNSEKSSPQLEEYRKWLVAAEQKSQEDFDKTVLSLSGGALGISFVFLKDVIGNNPISSPTLLFLSWISWAFSTFSVLASYYLSHLALRRAISQIDDGTIYEQKAGGLYATWTKFLNAAGATLFLFGVLFITAFAHHNFLTKGATNVRTEATTKPAKPAPTPAPTGLCAPTTTGQGHVVLEVIAELNDPKPPLLSDRSYVVPHTLQKKPLTEGYIPPPPPDRDHVVPPLPDRGYVVPPLPDRGYVVPPTPQKEPLTEGYIPPKPPL